MLTPWPLSDGSPPVDAPPPRGACWQARPRPRPPASGAPGETPDDAGAGRRRARSRSSPSSATPAPPPSSTWTTPSCRAPRSSTSAAACTSGSSSDKRDLVRFAWQQAYFRMAGVEDPEHMQEARDSALSIVKGHRVDELMSIGEEIYDEYMAERDLARHPRPRPGPPGRRTAGLAGHRRPGRDRHDHRPPARPDRRAGHRRRVRRRRLHRHAWSASRCTARPRPRRCGRWPPRRASTSSRCAAYSDSANDIPMLSLVGHPYAINPDSRLRKHAREPGLAAARLPHRPQGGEDRHPGGGRRGRRGRRRGGRRGPARAAAAEGHRRGNRPCRVTASVPAACPARSYPLVLRTASARPWRTQPQHALRREQFTTPISSTQRSSCVDT